MHCHGPGISCDSCDAGDMWSLGAVLLSLLRGSSLPFDPPGLGSTRFHASMLPDGLQAWLDGRLERLQSSQPALVCCRACYGPSMNLQKQKGAGYCPPLTSEHMHCMPIASSSSICAQSGSVSAAMSICLLRLFLWMCPMVAQACQSSVYI